MKILFYGRTKGNSGPSNVNKAMIRNLSACFWCVAASKKYLQMVEGLSKCLFSDVVVVSGPSRQGMMLAKFAKFFRKKVVYVMHGCVEYEAKINRQKHVEAALQQERFLLERADLLLPVSKKFREWVCNRYPQYTDKTKYLYNGIDKALLADCSKVQKNKGTVAATGADRVVKNNLLVACAVEEMAGRGKLAVYGAIYHGVPNCFEHTRYTGVVAHSEYINRLKETELFVVNSIFETFSISVIEALCCGCSVLISEIVGVTDLLDLEESDVIHDPMDVQEIREKIEYLLEHPNNERIMSKLDLDEYSYEKSVERLEGLCRDLLEK